MSARDVQAAFAERIRAVNKDPDVVERLVRAPLAVAIHCSDDPGTVFTLRFDREPVELVAGAQADAEVRLNAPAAVWRAFLAGELHLPAAIVRDEVSYGGPVRRFLRLTPILRAHGRSRDPEEAVA